MARTKPSRPAEQLGGALVDDLTDARSEGPAGDLALLPLDASVYADAAATTTEDVEGSRQRCLR